MIFQSPRDVVLPLKSANATSSRRRRGQSELQEYLKLAPGRDSGRHRKASLTFVDFIMGRMDSRNAGSTGRSTTTSFLQYQRPDTDRFISPTITASRIKGTLQPPSPARSWLGAAMVTMSPRAGFTPPRNSGSTPARGLTARAPTQPHRMGDQRNKQGQQDPGTSKAPLTNLLATPTPGSP